MARGFRSAGEQEAAGAKESRRLQVLRRVGGCRCEGEQEAAGVKESRSEGEQEAAGAHGHWWWSESGFRIQYDTITVYSNQTSANCIFTLRWLAC